MRDTVMEKFLTDRGTPFDYHEVVPIESIVLTDAARQNIRPVGIDQEKVFEYGLALTGGATFPAVVLYPKSKDKYAVLTGCHRIEAFKLADIKQTDAYVLALDDVHDERTIEVFQRTLNMLNGLPYAREERIQHALRLHARGHKINDVARMMNLTPSSLLNRLGALSALDRARSMGITVNQDILRESQLIELNRIKNPVIFKALAELCHAARLTSDQMKDLSKEIRDQETDDDRQKVVDKWRERVLSTIKETGGGQFGSPTANARRALAYLNRLDRQLRLEMFATLTPHERNEVVKQLKAAIIRFQKLVAQLQAVDTRVRKPA